MAKVDFTKRYDVVVAGGGIAGVAAALQAARSGLTTALVEKTILLGGLATAGLVNIYLPLCDGYGTQVIYGIAEELLYLSIKYGPGEVPTDWRESKPGGGTSRYRAEFSPASFVLALDEILEQAGVELWLDTVICDPLMEGGRVAGIEVVNKSGRGALLGRVVIDATGDADVAYRAGSACAEGGNWLSFWALRVSLAAARQAVAAGSADPLLSNLWLGAEASGKGSLAEGKSWRGTDAAQVTRFVLGGRRLLRHYYQELQARNGERSRTEEFPLTLPTLPQFRTTRRIAGRTTLTDGQWGMHRPDSIGLMPDWRTPGFVWEVPFGALVPSGVGGLLTAGRCISAEGDAWEIVRAIPAVALTGQVAALAAYLALQRGLPVEQLDAAAVQGALQRQGLPLHLEDVGLRPTPRVA